LGRLKTLLLQETIDWLYLGYYHQVQVGIWLGIAACLGAEEDDVLYAIASMGLEAIQEAGQSLAFPVGEVRQAGF